MCYNNNGDDMRKIKKKAVTTTIAVIIVLIGVGRVSVSLDGKEYFSEDIYIKDRVKKEEVKLNFWQRLIKRLKELW